MEIIILSEICQIQKGKPHLSYMRYLDLNQYLQINTYIWSLKVDDASGRAQMRMGEQRRHGI